MEKLAILVMLIRLGLTGIAALFLWVALRDYEQGDWHVILEGAAGIGLLIWAWGPRD